MSFTLSPSGLALLKRFEACRLTAYQDVAGIWTIGYGSTRIHGVPVVSGQVITQAEAEEAVVMDCAAIGRQLVPLLTVPQTQNQVDALISFCYNLGVPAFSGSSLRHAINASLPIDASLFTRWNKARNPVTHQLEVVPGLTRRRNTEYTLYTTGNLT